MTLERPLHAVWIAAWTSGGVTQAVQTACLAATKANTLILVGDLTNGGFTKSMNCFAHTADFIGYASPVSFTSSAQDRSDTAAYDAALVELRSIAARERRLKGFLVVHQSGVAHPSAEANVPALVQECYDMGIEPIVMVDSPEYRFTNSTYVANWGVSWLACVKPSHYRSAGVTTVGFQWGDPWDAASTASLRTHITERAAEVVTYSKGREFDGLFFQVGGIVPFASGNLTWPVPTADRVVQCMTDIGDRRDNLVVWGWTGMTGPPLWEGMQDHTANATAIGSALMATYKETKRSRIEGDDPNRITTVVYGIANTTGDVNIPSKGDFLDDAAGSASTHAVCSNVETDPYWQFGRVLVKSTWVGQQAAIVLGP